LYPILDRRIWLLAQYYRMTLIQSDSILAIYEAEKCSDNHALTACLFAQELVAIIE
jgi:hypothetical protein